jgi:UPF0716 protein FxsA
MFPVLTIIFLIVPVVEIYLLIEVGRVIGALWTVFLVVLTAVVGVRLLKIQGISTLMRAQSKMQTGQMPAQEMFEGIGLVVAGAFLLTPGFFTDTVGFILLFPPTRVWLVSKVVSRLMTTARFSPQGGLDGFHYDSDAQPKKSESDVIEGVNYKRED